MKCIAAAAFVLVACQSGPPSLDSAVAPPASAPSAAAPLPAPSAAAPAPSASAPPVHWQSAFDLDGDGSNDTIHIDFSEGAHCCYRISVTLTSTGATTKLPFELDGGYAYGLDLGRPDHFDVRKIDAPLPEIVMEIETYNGEENPLPKEWKKRYGFSTHHIAVGFPGGKLRVRDVPSVNEQRH
jgi:hypothetical protein